VEDIYVSPLINGYVERIKPFVVENLTLNQEYSFDIRLGEQSGDDIAFRGALTIQEDGNFILKDEVRELTLLGYKIE
jgi:hypothetical protein